MPSASVSFPGPEQSSGAASLPRRARICSIPQRRLQRPDQHRRRAALRLADGVQQAVDPVGEVDVRAPGRAEQRRGACGEPDVGVTGGVVALIALGLDDHPADAVEPAARSRSGRARRREPGGRRTAERPRERSRGARRSGRRGPAGRRSSCSASARARGPARREASSRARHPAAQDLVVRRRRAARNGPSSSSWLELGQRAPALERGPDEPADDAVGLAERHPLARPGGRRRRSPRASRRRPPRPCARGRSQPGEHALGHLEAELDGVHGVEQRLLVLLEVLAVGERQRVQDAEEGRQRAGDARRLARAGARRRRGSSSAASGSSPTRTRRRARRSRTRCWTR